MKTPSDYSAFLESLKVKNEGREEYVGWQLNAPILNLQKQIGTEKLSGYAKNRLIEYLFRRVELAEQNAKPETLAEDVKAFMRAVVRDYELNQHYSDEVTMRTWQEWRRLSEPDKQGEG